ncbi:MAG: undecaprenyl/decaprenyl-phosphate alpha-N-acetylglucosaminyl 1-phosphate transferase [Chloroflexi bacterium]|nr:undecaprenyl/decaprenyl-phosphate alpha-N-acetylglucosaminyl 1-phosphate transferase [Chloroflexota bacterium]
MVTLWIVAVAALAVLTSYVVVGLAVRHAEKLGAIDVPRAGEVQVRAVPRSGGYGMLVAVWLAVGFAVFARPAEIQAAPGDDWKLLGVVLGSLLVIPLAMIDDAKRLGAAAQFGGQFAIAAIPVLFGLRIESIASPLGSAVELPAWLGILLTLLWIVGMINAINLIDVMDGLAGGIALMGAGVLFFRSLMFGQYTIAVLPLALAGATLGFLPHNFHPARIFMGTSGSVLLGYWLATMSVIGGAKVGTAFVVLGVPILNTAWVIGRRALAGRSPFKGGDSELLPQRLHALGLSQLQSVILLYAICGIFGLLSLTLHAPLEGPYLTPPMTKLWLSIGMVAVMGVVLATVTYLSVKQRQKTIHKL